MHWDFTAILVVVSCSNQCNILQLLVSLKMHWSWRSSSKAINQSWKKDTLTAQIRTVFYLACWQTAIGCDSANFCEVMEVQAWLALRWEKAKGKSCAARSVVFWWRSWHFSVFKGREHFGVITGDVVLLEVPSFMHDMKIASGLYCSWKLPKALKVLFCMACSNFQNNLSAASLTLHSYDNKCLRYCVWRTMFARGECLWNVTEALVINGNLVQDFSLNQVEVVLLCICNGLRVYMALATVAQWTSCNSLYTMVTQSLAVLFWMETAISFEHDWVFSHQKNV